MFVTCPDCRRPLPSNYFGGCTHYSIGNYNPRISNDMTDKVVYDKVNGGTLRVHGVLGSIH